ncbi:MAG: DUF4339 domain-containing protein [Alphaproteobacteria bacterium]|nr:DUF4339 domain-containing protein [Alphaproteobacteria bacterium]
MDTAFQTPPGQMHGSGTRVARWRVRIGERVYGPYGADQIKTYVDEGRILATSLLAPEGSEDWRKAARHPELAVYFAHASEVTREGTNESAQEGAAATKPDGEGNVLIFLEDRWRPDNALESAIRKLGRAQRIHPSLWVLRTRFSAHAIRSHLSQYLDENDHLFVVDATNDQAASYNMGPDADTRLNAVWSKS